jgi:hypothetical protein
MAVKIPQENVHAGGTKCIVEKVNSGLDVDKGSKEIKSYASGPK